MFEQILASFRKELVAKHLIIEEIKKVILFINGEEHETPHEILQFEQSKEDINWEIQLSTWTAEVYLNNSNIHQLFSILETEMKINIRDNLINI